MTTYIILLMSLSLIPSLVMFLYEVLRKEKVVKKGKNYDRIIDSLLDMNYAREEKFLFDQRH